MDFKLRFVEEEDLNFLSEIRKDPEVEKNLGTFAMLNKLKQREWFYSMCKDETKMYCIFENKIKGFLQKKIQKIGYVRIINIDQQNKSMCVGGDIHKEFRNKGYSKEMYKLIFELGFEKLNMNRLWLLVLADNKRAKHIYEKMGFIEEGRQRQAIFKNGEYRDYIMMSILKDEYNKKYLDDLIIKVNNKK